MADQSWRPVSEAVGVAGDLIQVRIVEVYRWLPYKADGRRQTGKTGRWQKYDGYGWQNANLPEGAEFAPLPPRAPPLSNPMGEEL